MLKQTKHFQKLVGWLDSKRIGQVMLQIKGSYDLGKARIATAMVGGAKRVSAPFISAGRTAGATYQLWRLQRKIDVCGGGVSTAAKDCSDLDRTEAEFVDRTGESGLKLVNDPDIDVRTLYNLNQKDEAMAAVKLYENGVSGSSIVDLVDLDTDLVTVQKSLAVNHNKWSFGQFDSRKANLEDRYNRHGSNLDIRSEKEYELTAEEMLDNKFDHEIYYQKDKKNIAVYDRENNRFVAGNRDGEIQTFYVPQDEYVKDRISDNIMVRLN